MSRPGCVAAAAVSAALLCPGAAAAMTFNVNTTSDDFNSDPMTCSLREAAQSATQNSNAQSPGCPTGDSGQVDTIVLGATTYALTQPVADPNDDDNDDGDLDVGN